jgi:hypothetical protein
MITAPVAFTRRVFEPQEVIISCCNTCFSTVGESQDESGLDIVERGHSCTAFPKLDSTEESIQDELHLALC